MIQSDTTPPDWWIKEQFQIYADPKLVALRWRKVSDKEGVYRRSQAFPSLPFAGWM